MIHLILKRLLKPQNQLQSPLNNQDIFSLLRSFSSQRSFSIQKGFSNQRGFTMAEIAIVMAIIIGLLAFIAPKIRDGQTNSKISKTKMTMSEITTRIDQYNSDCGKYPTSLSFITDDDPSCKNWTASPSMKHLLKDGWGNDLQYEVSGNGYNLKSLGADKKEGGTGPDKDIYSESSVGGE